MSLIMNSMQIASSRALRWHTRWSRAKTPGQWAMGNERVPILYTAQQTRMHRACWKEGDRPYHTCLKVLAGEDKRDSNSTAGKPVKRSGGALPYGWLGKRRRFCQG